MTEESSANRTASRLARISRPSGGLDTQTHGFRVFVEGVAQGRFSSIEGAAESAIILAKERDCFVIGPTGLRWDKSECRAVLAAIVRRPEAWV